MIGQVYFAPEAHAAYEALGFGPSSGESRGVALPDGPAYFTSRGSLLGDVPGAVVAATFAVFSPDVVVACIDAGRSLTDVTTIREARDRGATGQLERLLGTAPDGLEFVEAALRRAAEAITVAGRPLAAGSASHAPPDHRLGAMFRAGDTLREFRGDSHTAAWIRCGLDATEIGLLTELFWGLPLRSYSRSRGWTADQFDEAEQRLVQRGLVQGGEFTSEGRALREQVEVDTDTQLDRVVESVGADLDRLVEVLESWSQVICDGNGYPAAGPHQLAERAQR